MYKNTLLYLGLIVWLTVWLAGCSGQKKQSLPDTTEASNSSTPIITNHEELGRIGDSTAFPYIYLGQGRSLLFEAYTMRFRLEHDDLLVPRTNDQVPWINPDNAYNDNNGFFITYVRNGRPVKLDNPYIQVQYINKVLPYCGSVDSVYMWLDQQFLNVPGSRVLKESFSTDTPSRLKAYCKEYQIPTANMRTGKNMAYAYIDYDDTYIIGLNLTCVLETDYEINLPLFYKMVESFAYY